MNELAAELDGLLIGRMIRSRSGGAEDADRLTDLAHRFESFDELGEDAEQPPGFLRRIAEQRLGLRHNVPHGRKVVSVISRLYRRGSPFRTQQTVI